MTRHYRTVNLGENQIRHIVVIESENCERDSLDSRKKIFELLESFCLNHHLVACGPLLFSSMNIEHNGEKWIIIAEAVESAD